MDLQLTGKRAIVCGASQGLGLACANALAAEGADVVINSRDSEKLNKAAAQIRDATGRSVQVCAADITQDDDRARLIESAPDSDILINNAGGPPPGDFRNWTQQDWMDALTLNMLAAIDLTRRVIDGMAARGFGRVLNITSSAVKAPIGILGLSNGARSGLTGFMSGLAREVAPQGVTINNLLPGPFDTDRLRGAHQAFADAKGIDPDVVRQQAMAASPVRRFGQPEEFGALCAFVCSPRAGYMNAQNLLLDGGAYAGTF